MTEVTDPEMEINKCDEATSVVIYDMLPWSKHGAKEGTSHRCITWTIEG